MLLAKAEQWSGRSGGEEECPEHRCYAEGVHTVGIDQLISEAGVAKGSLFYNFSGKDELVAAYLAGRDERRRQRIARHQEGLSDPVERLLAVFDALGEAVSSPGYNGCAFANAYAEAPPDSVEARALRTFRDWLAGTFLDLAREAGFRDPQDVAARLGLLYDGAVASAQLDTHPDAVRLAKDIAATVLAGAPRDELGEPASPEAPRRRSRGATSGPEAARSAPRRDRARAVGSSVALAGEPRMTEGEMADRQDGVLLVQLAQWGASMGLEEAVQAVWADDFDPAKASARDPLISRLLNWGETIGTLTKNGLIDTDLILDWLWVAGMWEKVGPAARALREQVGVPQMFENFEALAARQSG